MEEKIKKAVERLNKLKKNSPGEDEHIEADNILLEFVPKEVAEAYSKIDKWYA